MSLMSQTFLHENKKWSEKFKEACSSPYNAFLFFPWCDLLPSLFKGQNNTKTVTMNPQNVSLKLMFGEFLNNNRFSLL